MAASKGEKSNSINKGNMTLGKATLFDEST